MSKSAIFNNFSRMIQTSKNQNAKIKLSSFDELYKTVLLLLLEKIDSKFLFPRSLLKLRPAKGRLVCVSVWACLKWARANCIFRRPGRDARETEREGESLDIDGAEWDRLWIFWKWRRLILRTNSITNFSVPDYFNLGAVLGPKTLFNAKFFLKPKIIFNPKSLCNC